MFALIKKIIAALLILCLSIGMVALTPGGFSSAAEIQYDLYFNGKLLNDKAYYIKGNPYLPISLIGAYAINPDMEIDLSSSHLTIDLSTQNIFMADETTTNFVKANAGTVSIPIKTIEGTPCFPLNVTSQFFKLQYTVSEGTIFVKDLSGKGKIARITQNQAVAIPSLSKAKRSPVFLNMGDAVSVLGETDNYYKIELMDGTTAYIDKTNLTVSEIDLAQVDFYAPRQKKYQQGSEKISLVWEYVDKITPPAPDEKLGGIDILAPTWFDLIVNGNGNVENNGDKGYLELAHDKGYMVWATITNNMSTKGSTAFTTEALHDQAMLKKSVAQYIFYACLYGVDGINIDYETVADSDAEALTSFTAMLRQYTEKQGLVLSIDTLVPRPWTQEYDRDELARYVDYMIVMSYDEHYGSSLVAGSVASLPWVEDAVIASLTEIPASKLLIGIPLYMRAWHFDSNGSLVNNTANTMTTIRTILTEKALTPVWLEKEAQYYIEYPDSGLIKKIWIENQRSIAHKLELVQHYNLAGAASWRLGQEEEAVWSVYEAMLKRNASVEQSDLPY